MEGKRSLGYKALRKLGNRPGESERSALVISSFAEQGLTAQQSADRLAEHFSAISKSVDPLAMDKFHPALQQALEEGRTDLHKPVLNQYQVYSKMCRVTKPKSSVFGDVPVKIIKQFTFEYAKPAAMLFNKIIQSSQWPSHWKVEQTIVLSKCKTKQPQDEDDLRTISKTQWLSKLLENILGDYILPIVDKYIDPGQCGGLKNSSISHYLVKLLDFVHRALDQTTPHAAILSGEDLSKAYNRGSHQLVIEDLHSMHVTPWVLSLLYSYLQGRSLVLTYQKARSSVRPLPGGFGAGTFMGGLLFIIKFNGACLRPPVPRPFTGNKTLQLKYIDDSSKVATVNLKRSLEKDPVERPRPWNYHERNQMVIRNEENSLQFELTRFHNWAVKNKFLVNTKKCYVMQFSRSRTYDFPVEYTIGESEMLEEKKTVKILGIQVQSDLRWQSQVTQMITRASKTTRIIRMMRVLGVDRKTLVDFWKSEGRVHLEMAAPVWHSSLTVAQRRSLDRCQRVAMAAIVGHWAPSLTGQLSELGLERLSDRRDRLCARFAMATAAKSRHKDIFKVARINQPRPGKRFRKFVEPRARTAFYRKSAVPYLTRLLNNQ